MFSFVPKTDEEILQIKNNLLLKDGIYPFAVTECREKISNNNNLMLRVVLSIKDQAGDARIITDYLPTTDNMIFKLKHFCESIGFEKEYAAGTFDPLKCEGRTGVAFIGVQKGGAKQDGSGFYNDKNNVKDYLKPSEHVVAKADVEFNDAIPF